MRIAQIAPIIERVPPKKYGGTERVVSALTDELVRRGHDVTLFATGDSISAAKLSSVYPHAIRESRLKSVNSDLWSLYHLARAYDRQAEFDVIHDHTGYLGLGLANLATTPAVITMHGQFTRESRIIFKNISRPPVVTISQAQRNYAPDLNHIGTVYNGLDMTSYPFSDEHDGYLLFVGRISEEKGVHLAIDVARYLDLPLIIAAKLDRVDVEYFREEVEPFLNENIRWIGEVSEEERNKLYSRALAMLHPITWREPFGLTIIEAMACGCPVVAIGKGSIPELILDQQTGFVVNDVEEMLDAVLRINTIDRQRCRDHALNNFSDKKMTDGYEQIYQRLINQHA
jgi:glycosyltransferase involved in cell wall biosynthesis